MVDAVAPRRGRLAQIWRSDGWRMLVALLVLCALDVLLTNQLTVSDLVDDEDYLTIELTFPIYAFALALACFFWLRGQRVALRRTVFILTVLVSLSVAESLAKLVWTLDLRKASENNVEAWDLLWDAGIVWITGVLLFSIWYWLMDGGGPDVRTSASPERPDFLFTQQSNPIPGWEGWRPDFIDYLFLAFSSSTAFSATDTLPLSRRAKLLVMAQALLSLVILISLVARAVNILS